MKTHPGLIDSLFLEFEKKCSEVFSMFLSTEKFCVFILNINLKKRKKELEERNLKRAEEKVAKRICKQ